MYGLLIDNSLSISICSECWNLIYNIWWITQIYFTEILFLWQSNIKYLEHLYVNFSLRKDNKNSHFKRLSEVLGLKMKIECYIFILKIYSFNGVCLHVLPACRSVHHVLALHKKAREIILISGIAVSSWLLADSCVLWTNSGSSGSIDSDVHDKPSFQHLNTNLK